MASKAERLRLAYESKLGKDLVSKLSDEQIKLISRYYNSLSNSEQSNLDNRIFKGYSDTDLHEMARGFIEEENDTDEIPEGLDDILNEVRSEKKESAGALAVVNSKKFFGEDRYDKYYQEILSEGRIDGDNLSPEERKEGVKAYKKGKIDFETFVNKVLDQKKQVELGKTNKSSIGPGGGALVVRKKSQIQTSNLISRQEQSDQNLDEILKGIDSILNTLKEEQKLKKKESDRSRKASEQRSREAKEKRLESNVFGNLFKSTQKILKPVKSIFDRLLNFIGTVLLGRILFKLVDWMSDKENQRKLEAIGTFLSNTWPALLGAYLLFGNGLGRFVTRMLAMTLRFIPRIALALVRLAAAHPIAAAAIIGAGAFAAGAVIPKLMPETVDEQERQTEAAPGSKEEKIQKLKEQKENLNVFQKMQGVGAEIDEQIYKLETGETKRYSGGGLVEGLTGFSGGGKAMGTDTIPAMLTPGEFVMSKGAVDMFGANTFASMNAAGGGTNRPKSFGGRVYAAGGGAPDRSRTQGRKPEENRQPNERQPSSPVAAASATSTPARGGISKNAKALLNTIRWAEGTLKPGGYNTWFGGRADMDLTKMTINQVVAEQKKRLASGQATYGRYTSAAVGAYQMMKPELFAARAGLNPAKDKFTPENQDKMAIVGYMQGQARMSRAEIDAPISKGQIAKMAPVWASLPMLNGRSAHGQPVKRYADLVKIYNKNLQGLDPNSYSSSTTVASSSGGGVLHGTSGGTVEEPAKVDWSSVKGLGSDVFASASGTNQGIPSGSPAVLGRNGNKLRLPSAPPSVRSASSYTVPSSSESSGETSPVNSTNIPNIPMRPPSITKAKVLGVSVG